LKQKLIYNLWEKFFVLLSFGMTRYLMVQQTTDMHVKVGSQQTLLTTLVY